MIGADLILAAVVEAMHTPDPAPVTAAGVSGEWRVQRPNRGLAGRYLDSNVPAVWHGVPDRVRATWLCIRLHESRSYTGENPTSSASGAGQWILSTWTGLKRWVKVNGVYVARQYREAKDAPAWVQDAAYLHVERHGGLRMWRGTGCPGTG